MNTQSRFWAAILALMIIASPVLAHHGTNISYDHSKPTKLKGTVTEFVWLNPHCQLYFDVKDDKNNIVHWAGELNSPSVLGRQGWTKRQFKAGDQIEITVFPSKVGSAVGVVDRSHGIIANGKEVVPPNTNVD